MEDTVFKNLKEKLPKVKRNILMKEHTTFKIGGPAEYFLVTNNTKEIMDAIRTARQLKIPVFIFGGGSNLLVADEGIKGLVIKLHDKNPRFEIKNNTIKALSGVDLQKLVDFSTKNSLAGLEWAGGLPGTFGGAIRGNAGAFGGEMKDVIKSVEALDGDFKVRKFSHEQCQFSYRTSIFKRNQWTVLSAVIQFKNGNKKDLEAIAKSHIQYRKERHPLEYGSAGSIFKNIDVKKMSAELQEEFADKVKQDPFPIVPAAWLVIGAGLTGTRIGNAEISKKHSNYIVNLGNAKAKDVLALIELARREIKKKYGIELEAEVQTVGK